ncbi:hypothetical protein [Oceanobacillus senegalensis]|uniref:hypothetical protein n=1 Tax=Oceanobacillus senegalensis TaxID=1936063 RepID=UPI0015C48A7F|nr:hypothetical protein [Oceanobacillus senegalensis]
MKQLVRYFSIGLFTAGILMLIGIFLFDNKGAKELSTNEMISLIEKEGYHVLSNSEYISLSVNSDETKEKTKDKDTQDKTSQKKTSKKGETTEDKNKNSSSDEGDEKSTYTINIKSGMPTSEISSLLEKNKIIKNASDFTDYLEEHDYSLKVQLGEFKVSSDMSFYELAETLTN